MASCLWIGSRNLFGVFSHWKMGWGWCTSPAQHHRVDPSMGVLFETSATSRNLEHLGTISIYIIGAWASKLKAAEGELACVRSKDGTRMVFVEYPSSQNDCSRRTKKRTRDRRPVFYFFFFTTADHHPVSFASSNGTEPGFQVLRPWSASNLPGLAVGKTPSARR